MVEHKYKFSFTGEQRRAMIVNDNYENAYYEDKKKTQLFGI